jgi:hypothetical protein
VTIARLLRRSALRYAVSPAFAGGEPLNFAEKPRIERWHGDCSGDGTMTARGDTTIRTHVTFHGAERYVAHDEDLDDPASGEGILRLIGQRLERFGLGVEDIVQEATGSLLEVASGEETWRVCAAHRGGDWYLHVADAEGSSEDAPPTAGLAALVDRIDGVLRRLPGIRRVAWHTSEDWSAGEEEGGTSRPCSELTGPPRPPRVRRRRPIPSELAEEAGLDTGAS